MRQREALAALAVFAVLAVSCVLLNAIVQGQPWPAEARLPDFPKNFDHFGSSNIDRSLAEKGPARRKVLGVVGVQVGLALVLGA